jgi:hypothetical protein
MKYLYLILFTIPLFVQASWMDSKGNVIPDTNSMRSIGDFGVKMMLTPSDAQFRQTWESTKHIPKLQTTDSVRVGSPIAVVLIFHGCTPNQSGVCDLASKFFLVNPDGSKIPAGGGPVWSGKPMPERILQLGRASMAITFDGTDPLGEYNILAEISDRVSNKNLSLISSFMVTK